MKYLGGKQRLGKVIGPILHDIWTTGQSAALSCELINSVHSVHSAQSFGAYIEPFCGSLGVLRVVADTFPASATILASDYHPDLIQMWREVQDGTFQYPAADVCSTEEDYLRIKAMKLPNGAPSSLKAFIGFGLGFSGRYFASFAPKYANGKKEDFLGEMTHSVQAVQAILQKRCGPPPPTHGGVLGGAPSPPIFRCRDYREVVAAAAASEDGGGSIYLIYCDPPYRSTKFPIKYRRDVKHYDDFDSDEFWETMRAWSAKHTVLISEMSAPDDFVEVWSMQRYRSACQSTRTRFKVSSSSSSLPSSLDDTTTTTTTTNAKSVEYKNEKLFVHSSRVAAIQ